MKMSTVAEEHALAAEAKRLGISVTQLMMQKAVTTADGRDVVQQIVWDNIGRNNPSLHTGKAGKAGPTYEPQLENRTGWRTAPALQSPPGQDLIQRMCKADAARQRAEAIAALGPEAVAAEMKRLQGLIDQLEAQKEAEAKGPRRI
jgi:hypothetical protein